MAEAAGSKAGRSSRSNRQRSGGASRSSSGGSSKSKDAARLRAEYDAGQISTEQALRDALALAAGEKVQRYADEKANANA